jgi:uncharacterized membrane protein
MLKTEYLFWLIGAFLLITALFNLRERRYAAGIFWLVLVAPFAFGTQIQAAAKAGVQWPAQAMGIGVMALGILATRGRFSVVADTPQAHARRQALSEVLRNKLSARHW